MAELPHFDELYRTYGGSIEVIALHSDLVTDDVEAYLSNYDYTIHFALDASGRLCFRGDGGMLAVLSSDRAAWNNRPCALDGAWGCL